MKISDFIKNFFSRKGKHVFWALLGEKIAAMLLVLFATNMLSKEVYGAIAYANSTLTFIFPFVGFGVHQGLVRYGAISKSQQEKKYLFNMALKRGVLFSFFLLAVVLLLSPFTTAKLASSLIYLSILSAQIVSLFVLETVKIYARLIRRNKLFSRIVLMNSLILLSMGCLLTYCFGGVGYVVSLVIVPLIIGLIFIVSLKLTRYNKNIQMQVILKDFMVYGLYASFSGVLSQLLYAIDILLVGNILQNESAVAEYKIATILPFSLLFLPIVFMTTDFVHLANKGEFDRQYLKKYYLNYLKIFTFISLCVISVFFFFESHLYALFGDSYSNEKHLMLIFSFGAIGGLMFRVPLGNMISAVGLVKTNTQIVLLTFLLNIVLSYYLLLNYGVIGAALSTSFLMWFSGALNLFVFLRFLKGANKIV